MIDPVLLANARDPSITVLIKAILCLRCNAMCFKASCYLLLQGRIKDDASGRFFQNVDISVPN